MLVDHSYPTEPVLRDFKVTLINFPQYLLLILIRIYQKTISPALPGNTCRFYPSCSHFGYQAVYKYGVLKGIFLAIKRIIRCNPFNQGGYDPVP
ncbi:MAG TPA: membrane protein insertion efficiency factor YidD [Pelolinea sp.]|nr:membrane protein insertion efficiency factor YidD [Pelolinea sp.]